MHALHEISPIQLKIVWCLSPNANWGIRQRGGLKCAKWTKKSGLARYLLQSCCPLNETWKCGGSSNTPTPQIWEKRMSTTSKCILPIRWRNATEISVKGDNEMWQESEREVSRCRMWHWTTRYWANNKTIGRSAMDCGNAKNTDPRCADNFCAHLYSISLDSCTTVPDGRAESTMSYGRQPWWW